MDKFFMLLIFCAFSLCVNAQTQPAIKTTQPFSVIDTADLKMTSCDFEKDANAEVLFDKETVSYKVETVIAERHKRIKILNDKGKDEANVRIEYLAHSDENITDIQAETINLNNKTIEYTSIDKKLIYTQDVDKKTKAIIFTFPNVRPGTVIEFKYKKTTPYGYNYPDWFFQTTIPTRYSEFDASFIPDYKFSLFTKIYQHLVKDTAMATSSPKGTRGIWAMANIKAYKEEPYMDYPEDYMQCVLSRIEHKGETWASVGDRMMNDYDFGQRLKGWINNAPIVLSKEDGIISAANKLKSDKEKIAYIFDTVRNVMKWNKINRWYCDDEIKKAWDKKTGNSAEINMILYHFLAMANVDTYLLTLRTRNFGKLEIAYPSWSQFNKTVVYCKDDSAKQYVLDATDKLNSYRATPLDLTGLYALSLEAVGKKYVMLMLNTGSDKEVTLTTGSINADGKLEGTSQTISSTYSRKKYLEQYNELGESKYIDEIQKANNGLKITSLKIGNIQNDTLPLNQSFDFKYDLTSPDCEYMYFSPNLLTGFSDNPFLSSERISNIDFGCMYNYSLNGRYKLPPGYKIDALPKQVKMQMPDSSITFKRLIDEQDGAVVVHYTIEFNRSLFSKEEYPSIRVFYKKMYELLNEQVVLKKS